MTGIIRPPHPFDSQPYRHRVQDAAGRRLVTAPASTTLFEASTLMTRQKVGSLVVVGASGLPQGIVTESDIVRALSRLKDAAFTEPLENFMARPVATIAADDRLYQAMGRMTRLGLRHLVVTDQSGRPVGVITARDLIRFGTNRVLVIGDSLAEAATAADLGRARGAVADLAATLMADETPAHEVASLIAQVVRDITARAGIIAETAMARDGWGPAPASWALLVLGSAGRGESLLAFDQDNAIVHDGDGSADPWFAEFGRRLNNILDQAGIPYCQGHVMAGDAKWRRSLDQWKDEIRRWVFEPALETVMSVDIFFDFVPVLGDVALAQALKEYAVATAGQSAFFMRFMALNAAKMEVPIGLFGQFVTTKGRFNAKKAGLLPLVGIARARALSAGIAVTGTAPRYRALTEAGQMSEADLDSILAAHETVLAAVLAQQLADIKAGRAPTALVDPAQSTSTVRARLKAAFARIRALVGVMGGL